MRANLIAGQWTAGKQTNPNINPSDVADVIDQYASGDAAAVDAAVAAARAAFPAWSVSTPQQRFDALDLVGTEILARRAELGELLAREEGKTLPEATGEAARAGQIFKFFAGEALRTAGEIIPSVRPGMSVEVTREPIGVVGLITPWNFPIAIPAWKIAPALAYGNCVLFKPAELVPGCGWALADILSRSGLPAGVFNLVMGRGSVVGEAIINHPGIDGISFTGSQAVGRRVGEAAFKRGAKFQLEMGGKNPLVVLDDAQLDQAVEVAVQGSFYSTGQRCTASSRIIVTQGIHDTFVSRLAERARALVVGERVKRDRNGYYFAPAVFAEAKNSMRICREEIFGPVAAVVRARDYDEALALANDTEFGLSSGICTTSLKHASHFKRHAQAGLVMVNAPTAGVDYHVPFGGRKGSSYGPREQGRYAVEFYTTVKTAYTLA